MPATMLVPEYESPSAARHGGHLTLADALDRILHRGVSLQGNLTVGLANIDLLYLDLRLLLGSIDTIWPDGPPPAAVRPWSPSPQRPDVPPHTPSQVGARGDLTQPESVASPSLVAADEKSGRGSLAAQGLVRLVLTLVKLLHEVLERQAVRRMEAGRLTEAQVEAVGSALFAQAEEISRLQRQFNFSDQDLSLGLGVPDGAL